MSALPGKQRPDRKGGCYQSNGEEIADDDVRAFQDIET